MRDDDTAVPGECHFAGPAVAGRCRIRHHLGMQIVDRSLAQRLWPALSQWQVAALLGLVLGIGTEIGLAPEDDAAVALGSADYYLFPVVVAFCLAVALLLFLAPLVGFILTALLSTILALVPGVSSLGPLWLAPAALAALAAFRLVQRPPVSHAQHRRLPPHGDYPSSVAYRSPLTGLILLAVLPVVAAGLFGWHQVALGDAIAFAERAEQVSATVISPVNEDGEFTVLVDGREHVLEAWSLDEDPSVGDEMSVLVDPEDQEQVVPVDGIDDPSWTLLLALLAVLLMPYPYARWVRPARERRRLVEAGGPMRRARLLDLPSGATYLLPVDGTWPAVRLTDLEPLLSAEEIERQLEEFEAENDDADEAEPLPWTTDELERFLRADPWTESDQEIGELCFGPDAERPVPVDVIGDPRRGSSVAIVQGEGLWLTQLHTSNWRPGLRNQLRNATRSTLPTGMLSRLQNFHPQLLRGLWAVGAAASMPLLVLVAVGAEEWLRPLLLAGSLVASGLTLGLGEGAVSLRPGRLTLHGTHSDEVVVPSQVVSVAAVDDLVALRVNNPDDVVVITADALAGRFGATGQEALERIALWRGIGDTGARPGPRLSLLLWLTVATAGVGLAAVGVALW